MATQKAGVFDPNETDDEENDANYAPSEPEALDDGESEDEFVDPVLERIMKRREAERKNKIGSVWDDMKKSDSTVRDKDNTEKKIATKEVSVHEPSATTADRSSLTASERAELRRERRRKRQAEVSSAKVSAEAPHQSEEKGPASLLDRLAPGGFGGSADGDMSAIRESGLSALAASYGSKKRRISAKRMTEKDWGVYKERNAVDQAELDKAKGMGYVAKRSFLNRVDHRSYEQERAVRLANMKRNEKQ